VATRPLPYDPIAESVRSWRAAGWGDEAPGMALIVSIMRVHQIVLSRVDASLAPFELTFSRFEVLMLLSLTRSGELPLNRIGERLQVHAASVTNSISRLEDAGLVERVSHPTDGRTTLARITPAGLQLAHAAAVRLNADVFGDVGLDDDAVSTVVEALRQLRFNAGDFVDDDG